MIERFNFYDVYGYLIPGVMVLLLLVLPYALVAPIHWAEVKLESLALVLVVAYAVGHVIQSMATSAFPSSLASDSKGKPAFPSVVALSRSNTLLSTSLKAVVARLVEARFSIRLHVERDLDLSLPDDKAIAADRNTAFYLCRPLANKSSAYAEQFQGLYSLMRGLCVAFAFGACYDAGWLASLWKNDDIPDAIALVLGLAVMVALLCSAGRVFGLDTNPRNLDLAALIALGVALIGGGYILAAATMHGSEHVWMLVAALVFSLIAAFRFALLYRTFAVEFAKAVWTYFAVVDPEPAKPEKEYLHRSRAGRGT